MGVGDVLGKGLSKMLVSGTDRAVQTATADAAVSTIATADAVTLGAAASSATADLGAVQQVIQDGIPRMRPYAGYPNFKIENVSATPFAGDSQGKAFSFSSRISYQGQNAVGMPATLAGQLTGIYDPLERSSMWGGLDQVDGAPRTPFFALNFHKDL